MRRFERVQPGVPDRSGINPFTKQPIVIRGRPEITSRCEIAIDGNEVIRCSTYLHDGKPMGAPDRSHHGFADRESAEDYAAEYIDDLLIDGFREIGGSDTGVVRRRERPPLVLSPTARELPGAIIEHCRKRAWFGPDMELRFGMPPAQAAERRRFTYPRASEEVLLETERRLGFALPPMLRLLYAEVANGGFGPGYGFLGVIGGASEDDVAKDIAESYDTDRRSGPRLEESGFEKGDDDWFEPFYDEWPGGFVRVLHWGCAIWTCVDSRTGRVYRYEHFHGKTSRDAMSPQADSLEEWLQRWLRGELFAG